jgi:hypothetical protein
VKKSIIICEYISTGINYADDALARGYTPVLVEGTYVGSPDDIARFKAERERINNRVKDHIKIIPEQEDYNELLRLVKECAPAVVVAGSEFGVVLAARLAADLGLKGNPVDRIDAMTQKDATPDGKATLIIITHSAPEKAVQRVVKALNSDICKVENVIRVEG